MRIVLTTLPGVEELAQREVHERFGMQTDVRGEGVLSGEGDAELLVRIAYEARTLTQAFPLLATISKEDFSILDTDDAVLSLVRDTPIRVTRVHGLKAYEPELGRAVLSHFNLKADVKQPGVHIGFAETEEAFLLGPLLFPFNLCKRHYRLYTVPNTPSSCLAAALLVMAGLHTAGEARVADLIAYDGSFILEAAGFLLNLPVRDEAREPVSNALKERLPPFTPHSRDASITLFAADKNPNHVYRARQNARLMRVEDRITFTKLGLDWLELKLPEEHFTFLIGRLPGPSQRLKEKYYAKLVDEYFRLAAYTLTREGRIALLTSETSMLTRGAEAHGFALRDTRSVTRGDTEWHLSVFTRGA